jgi:cation diffusion facilitator CzcD-associated flavoprotein CzcO
MQRVPHVIIIGAGMSGIATAVKLKQAGFTDFEILEKGSRVGGVWHWNTYPGLTCDVPSLLYRYTFEGKPDWPHFFAKGGDIQEYHRKVVDTHALRSHLKLDTEVTGARYVEGRWQVDTADGERREADFVIAATGVLHHPNVPDIKGLADFQGSMFHTARWDHDVPLPGKRVAVIGNGSTGVQLTGALQPVARELKLFQRTPQWVLWGPTKLPQPAGLTKLLRRFPKLTEAIFDVALAGSRILTDITLRPGPIRSAAQRWARANLFLVRDKELRRKLTPDYEPFCKRQVVSGDFHRAVQRSNVDVITDEIDHVAERGVVTADGVLHEVDVIALATGFKAHNYVRPMNLVGRDGITIDDAWRDGTFAYLMTAIPGFPNFFTVLGPNSPVGSVQLQYAAERTADYIAEFLRRFSTGELDSVEVTAEASDRFNAEVRDATGPTVWNTGCNSWYLGENGAVDLWPFTRKSLTERLRTPDLRDYVVRQDNRRQAPSARLDG